MAYDLKPFVINLNDLTYLLAQVNFVPLFDGPANSNGIVSFDPATMDAWDASGNKVWDHVAQSGSYKDVALDISNVALLGSGFPQVSSSIGIRDVSGLHNNLFGDQAFWGAVDVPFRRDIAADFTNYITSTSVDYTPGNSVIDYMPRIISRTITTAGVNLLSDANGHYVNWDSDRYAVETAYAALIDTSGVDIAQLVEGAKIVAPINTEVAILDGNGDPLVWSLLQYQTSVAYTVALAVYASSSYGGLMDSTGGTLSDGEAIWYRPIPSGALVNTLQTYQPDVLAYKSLVDANLDFSLPLPPNGTVVTTTITESGYGLLETLGHVDFQNPTSGEFFIGSENPGVAPVNSWFGIFGQFFDHGLDLIGKGGNGKVTIALETTDPLYRAPGTNGPTDPGNTKITVTRATIAGTDANGDPTYINHTSPFIDQSQTYGSVDQITNVLREWVPNEDGTTGYHAGMKLFDGVTLSDTWTRRWPDGTSQDVHDTLPTLSELRNHVSDTGRAELTWDDVANFRNRDSDGQLLDSDSLLPGIQTSNSGHALVLDMNPRFDAAHLASSAPVGADTVASRVAAAVVTLNDGIDATVLTGFGAFNVGRPTGTDTLTQNTDGTLNLHLGADLIIPAGAGTSTIPAGDYGGANAMMLWINFSDFSIMAPPATNANAAVGEILMATIGDHYIAGDGRVNENFGLTSIHHVFHEEHNYQVENLKSWIYKHDDNNPGGVDAHEQLHNWQDKVLTVVGDSIATGVSTVGDHYEDAAGNYVYANGSIAWNADKMFEGTKLIVEMEYQHAAVDQYARTITPRIQEFVGYSSGVDSTISLEYSQVAFRFGHSTIRETIDTVDPSGWMLGNVTRYALEKAFLTPQTFADEGVAAITLGLSRQQMNEVDEFITPALNQGLLGQPLDLAAINLARGRDLGIPTLNDFREGISLARYTSWDDFGKNMVHPESLVNFIAAYSFAGDVAKAAAILGLYDGTLIDGDLAALGFTAAEALNFMLNNATGNADLETPRDGFNHIDSWIGGLAEAHVPGGLLGETFDAVFVAQIQSLMDGDRFYYLYRLFGTQIHEEVNNGQFKDIVERNTGLSHLNGSIFAYADKYYDFNRAADGTLTGTGDNLADHLFHDTLAANPTLGIFSDSGASTDPNGTLISVMVSDSVRPDVVQSYIRDVRPELDPTQVHTVEGTPTSGADSHEVIVATENSDYIHGRAGDDTIYGEGGDDYIFADGGVDRLYGGAGNDMLDTGEGPDLADGGAGKDIIYGRGSGAEVGGFDQLVGGSGNDLIIGGEGIDKLSGGSGDDIIYGDGLTNPEMGNTDAFTHGGDGNDYIDTGASGDLLYGEEGDDYMVGGADQDLMQGGTGDDILRPGTPSQAVNGGPDEVIGDDGYTNSGFDLIDFSDYAGNAPGVVIDFATQTNPLAAIDGTTPFPAWWQIEGAIGSQNNDTFIGSGPTVLAVTDPVVGISNGSNWLIGGSGSDVFSGAGGDDLIVGGSVRLDQLIGQYTGAIAGNLVLGSAGWLADAMQTATGGTGYDNNTENAYSGASNRADGLLDASGLLSAANMDGLAHFQEMLRSRMFRDLVLGDGGTDGADTAAFSGTATQYAITNVVSTNGLAGLKIVDSVTGRDGTDLVTGVENFAFNTAVAASVVENATTVGAVAKLVDAVTDTFTYALSGADAAMFSVDANGDLQFVTGPDFEAPADAGANNVYNVTVSARNDMTGIAVIQGYDVTVTDFNEPPQFDLGTTTAFIVDENTVQDAATFLATDPESANVSFTLGGADAFLFSINPATGVLSFLAPPDFENALDADFDNVYNITVTASDGFNQTSLPITVEVQNVNEPPMITSSAAVSVAENTTSVTIVTGVDPDGPTAFTYGIAGGVDASLFSIEPGTGALTFNTPPNYEAPNDAGGDHVYNVDVSINDGTTTVTQSMTVSVTNVNEGPTGTLAINDVTPTEGSPITVSAAAISDEDGLGAFSYQWQSFNGTTWTPIAGATAASFTPQDLPLSVFGAQAGLQLRAVVTYTDGAGFATSVISAATGPTGVNWIAVPLLAPNFAGTAGDDIAAGGLGNNALNGGAGDDTLSYNVTTFFTGVTSGRDTFDGGANGSAAGDRFVLNGSTGAETFRIFTRAAALAAGVGVPNTNTEIVITRNGTMSGAGILSGATVLAELDNIEEITVNTLDVTANDGGGLNTTGSGDTIAIFGNFTSPNTSLNFSTITVNGSNAGDTIDISGLTSEHRIVFNASGAGGNVIGTLRPQDVVSEGVTVLPPGTVINPPPVALTLNGNHRNNTLSGQDGDDTLNGSGGNDMLRGGKGDDTINGGRGEDRGYGGAGDDVFRASRNDGKDTYHGGSASADAGNDTLDMSGILTKISVNLGSGPNAQGYAHTAGVKDTLFGIENIVTGSGHDTIVASTAHNVIDGGAGNDTFVFRTAAHADGDTLTSFEAGDRIDVSRFMGHHVTLVNGQPNGVASAGQISVSHEEVDGHDVTTVHGNLDTDAADEFTITINGHHNLTGSNFS